MRSTYVIGDIHGQYDKLVNLLLAAGLADEDLLWAGGRAELWFIGDFFDRGPNGIATIELLMMLQQQAGATGGRVGALLGNHELLVLAAHRFGQRQSGGVSGTFVGDWLRNGGVVQDLARLTAGHITWLASLPAMARTAGRLLLHADATFYRQYGQSVEEVNRAFARLLRSADAAAWDHLLGEFSERESFFVDADEAESFLKTFGGRQIIHGHTPISHYSQKHPEEVTTPLVYANGLCVNVDGGMYAGGPGFVYRLPELPLISD